MKSSDDKKQWVKDEEAAQVVYEIGLYIMDGLGPSQIARKLTERKILTPAAYYASKGRTTNVTKKGSPYAWDSSTIADIMDRWREYLGHTVNFKTRKKSYKSKKTLHNPESEWKIFDNTHEAIWTEAIADAARLARQTRRRPTKMGEMGMFSGMMFCADCGSIMYQCRATNFRRDQEYYLCSGYRKSRDVCGQTHSIRTVILEELVLQNLREIVSFASQRKDDFVKMVMDADMRQRNQDLAKRQKTLADAEKRIAELDTIFKRLYEDTISGKLSDERFQKLSTDYEKEQHQLQDVAAALRDEIEAEEQKSANVERFLSVVERYREAPLGACLFLFPAALFSGHRRLGGQAHSEVLRRCALRQQLRHDHQPLVAGILHVVLPAAGGQRQDGILLAEGHAVKRQPVLLLHLPEEAGELLTREVRRNIVEADVRDEAGRDLEHHVVTLHGEVDVGVLLHEVRIHVPVELGEFRAVRIAVGGGVAEDHGVLIQRAPAA